jgi:metal-dependent amidase/aminoacylase/carboxypeptidase family protein
VLSELTKRLIEEVAESLDQDLIDLRRAIHRHPELAGGEVETAALVADGLREAGLEVSTGVGGYAVVGILDCARPGATIGYRADMDAVAMNEAFESDFRSQVDGAGHLCGHDIHTAVGVGVARTLARVRNQLSGRVVFYFQPAEEALTGAMAMLDAGALDLARPDEIYALHCAHFPVGTFAVMPGGGLPGHDNFDLELSGPDSGDQAEKIAARIAEWSTVKLPSTPQEHQQLLDDLQLEDSPLARFVFAGAWTDVDADRAHASLHAWIKAWPDDL